MSSCRTMNRRLPDCVAEATLNPMPDAIIAWDSFVALGKQTVLEIPTRERGAVLT